MFYGCELLVTIEVGSSWDVTDVSITANMFTNGFAITGGSNTHYDENNTNGLYARVDGGPESLTPGYLTLKTI